MLQMDLKAWLEEIGMGEYWEKFEQNKIDEETLKEMTEDDLKDIGIDALGHRKKIFAEISEYKTKENSKIAEQKNQIEEERLAKAEIEAKDSDNERNEEFINFTLDYATKYDQVAESSTQESEQSTIRTKRKNKNIPFFSDVPRVFGWEGTIENSSEDYFFIKLRKNNEDVPIIFKLEFDNDDIKERVSNAKDGQNVIFGARVELDDEQDGILEKSITESGGMREPEYQACLESISFDKEEEEEIEKRKEKKDEEKEENEGEEKKKEDSEGSGAVLGISLGLVIAYMVSDVYELAIAIGTGIGVLSVNKLKVEKSLLKSTLALICVTMTISMLSDYDVPDTIGYSVIHPFSTTYEDAEANYKQGEYDKTLELLISIDENNDEYEKGQQLIGRIDEEKKREEIEKKIRSGDVSFLYPPKQSEMLQSWGEYSKPVLDANREYKDADPHGNQLKWDATYKKMILEHKTFINRFGFDPNSNPSRISSAFGFRDLKVEGWIIRIKSISISNPRSGLHFVYLGNENISAHIEYGKKHSDDFLMNIDEGQYYIVNGNITEGEMDFLWNKKQFLNSIGKYEVELKNGAVTKYDLPTKYWGKKVYYEDVRNESYEGDYLEPHIRSIYLVIDNATIEKLSIENSTKKRI